MLPTSPPRVFLSYARKDGEEFATALRQRLAADEPEITVWQDRTHLEGGVGWWKQIEAALDQVRFLVIVMTPRALTSRVTYDEWRYARQHGVVVYPVKGVPDEQLNYSALPKWMQKTHFFDVLRFADGRWHETAEWQTFVNFLKSDRQPVRVPFMAPDVPRGFVPRASEYEQLLRLVLEPAREDPIAITTALQGAGGYGKTTLAIALCHDERVSETFDDGVLWVSLGQTPDLIGALGKLYESLTGQWPDFIDAAHASAKLAEKLEHRKCLLVIDDVWQRAHLEPFLQGGRQCVRLVTTRRLDVVTDAARVRVDEMSAAESTGLLALAFPAGTVSAAALAPMARRLGEWPLLLSLAAGMIRRRLARDDSAESAIAHVMSALDRRGVTAFDQEATAQRNEAVQRTLAASTDQLSAEDARRFRELAIFPEETAVPLKTVGRLWDLDEPDAADCAQRLDDVSLLSLDLRRGVVTLHDVMRAYLLRHLADGAAVHRRFAAACGDDPDPSDHYAWRWLPYHLRHAGLIDELRNLLCRPAWLYGKSRALGPHALIADFELVRGDRDLDLVQAAFRLSLSVLAEDTSQLCEQLLGRLPPGFSDRVDSFRSDLAASAPPVRLHAPWPNLQTPGGGLVQTLSGHTAPVRGALLLSENRALSWSDDRLLRMWDLSTGEDRALSGHTGAVAGALLLTGDRALSWSADGTLRLWSLATCEGQPLTGHTRPIAGALLLPGDGALTWSDDQTVRVWDLSARTGCQLADNHRWVQGALRLPDGEALTWSADGTLRVWNLEAGSSRELAGHRRAVMGVLPLPDERALSWSAGGTLRVWHLPSAGNRILAGHEGRVTGVLLLPDEGALSWSADSTLRVWHLPSGESRVLTGHTDRVTGAVMLPDGRMLSWSDDHTLRAWNMEAGQSMVLAGHTGPVKGAHVFSDGRALSWSADRTIRVWDLATGEGRALSGHEHSVDGVLLLPDRRALSWSADSTVRVWDLATGMGRPMTGHQDWVTGGVILPGRRALTWSADHTLAVWSLTSGESRTLKGHAHWITGALLLPDGGALSWGAEPTLRVWNIDTGESRQLIGHTDSVTGAVLTGNRGAISWSDDQTLRRWDLETGEGRTLSRHRESIKGALLLPDDGVLSWGSDGTIFVWNVGGDAESRLVGHTGPVVGAVALPHARALSWSADGTLRLWDLQSGRSQVYRGHAGAVTGALAMTDERALSWSADGSLRLWDLASGDSRALEGHEDLVHGALIVPDGRALSWSADHTLRLWDLAAGTGHALTRADEWVTGALLLPDGRVLSSHIRSIRIRSPAGDEPELAFYFDATPTVVVPDPSGVLLVADALWRVHILETVREVSPVAGGEPRSLPPSPRLRDSAT